MFLFNLLLSTIRSDFIDRISQKLFFSNVKYNNVYIVKK